MYDVCGVQTKLSILVAARSADRRECHENSPECWRGGTN